MRQAIATIEKAKGEVVQVRLDEYQGADTIDIRVWTKNGEALHPTPKGIALSIWRLPELIDALREAETQARLAGIFEGQAPRRFGGSPGAHRRNARADRRMDAQASAAMERDADPVEA